MSNFSTTISVVMATYNGGQYLREQLNSIVSQTLQPTEIIIQDDYSSDNTVDIILEYTSLLPITLEINPRNLGYIQNFERALAKAQGEYIALCDQDDIWESNKLELLMDRLREHTLVYSNSLLIDTRGHSLSTTLSDKLKNRFISIYSPLSFIHDNCVSAHAMLFHHSLKKQLLPFPKHLYFDAWIAANAASMGGVLYLDLPLVRYRQHSSNTLSVTKKVSLSLSEKIAMKTFRKEEEHILRAKMITELLSITSLKLDERDILITLEQEHLAFSQRWFNLKLFRLFIHYRHSLFAITKRNSFVLAFKKSIGRKMYRLFPFL